MKMIISPVLSLFLIFQLTNCVAQRIDYKLVEVPVERNQIEVGVTSTFLKAKLHDNVKWYHAIEPRWTKVAGLQVGDEIKESFRDDYSDGNLRKAYFYQSSISSKEYVIVAVHAFDDGISSFHLFHYMNQNASYLGELAFFSVVKDPFFGPVNIYPKNSMSVIKKNEEF